ADPAPANAATAAPATAATAVRTTKKPLTGVPPSLSPDPRGRPDSVHTLAQAQQFVKGVFTIRMRGIDWTFNWPLKFARDREYDSPPHSVRPTPEKMVDSLGSVSRSLLFSVFPRRRRILVSGLRINGRRSRSRATARRAAIDA